VRQSPGAAEIISSKGRSEVGQAFVRPEGAERVRYEPVMQLCCCQRWHRPSAAGRADRVARPAAFAVLRLERDYSVVKDQLQALSRA
jgi:hypothetical protein